jgi:hypothetical protein
VPTPALLARGAELLGEKAERLGTFPSIVADYRHTLGSKAYAAAIAALGGRFFVWDALTQKVTSEIDLASKTTRPLDRHHLRGMSTRSWDVSGEASLTVYVTSKRQRVIALVPLSVDRAIMAALEQILQPMALRDFTVVRGVYSRQGGDLLLTIASGTTRAGQVMPLSVRINLSAAVRAA